MKIIFKLIVSALFMPVLIFAFIIALIRTLFVLIFEFAWSQSGEWHLSMMESVYRFIGAIKTQSK